MGRFVNPDNSAFEAAVSAKIYVDKSGLLNYTNSVLASTELLIQSMLTFATAGHADLANR